jgi:hypothetical protein
MSSAPWYAHPDPAAVCHFENQASRSCGSNNVRRYYSKPAFYIFLPTFEIIVLVMYVVARVDRMFYALRGDEQSYLGMEEREMN